MEGAVRYVQFRPASNSLIASRPWRATLVALHSLSAISANRSPASLSINSGHFPSDAHG